MSNPTVLLAVADGTEDVEMTTILDLLRRAQIDVKLVSVMHQRQVTLAHGLEVRAEALLADVIDDKFDALVLPGGMPGAEHLSTNPTLVSMLKEQNAQGKLVAAICASPAVVLAKHGLLEGKQAVAYPGFEDGLKQGRAEYIDQPVVVDGNIITSKGPATAMAFSLKIIETLKGEVTAKEVAAGLLYS